MCACLAFFLNYSSTTEIYTLSLHDALPILGAYDAQHPGESAEVRPCGSEDRSAGHLSGGRAGQSRNRFSHGLTSRSEEHTSELQSRQYLVCRLLLEKKKKIR